MTREIKFRAWNQKAKKMFSAKELGEDQLTLMPDGRGFVNVDSFATSRSEFYSDLIPLQFTGLKDKNGVEIYEGDIVGIPYESDDEQGFTGKPRAVVEWNKGSFTVKCFNGNRFDLFAEEGRLEVFGNIYENPKLLEVK